MIIQITLIEVKEDSAGGGMPGGMGGGMGGMMEL
jgi:chaperonin GroEL